MKDLFVSHVEEDVKLALELALQLESRGYSTWCFELDNAGDYLRGIRGAVAEARGLLVLVSRQSLANRDQVAREIHMGHSEGKWFIPLQCGLSEAEWDGGVPPTWREAFAEAVRVPVAVNRLFDALERIQKSLQARGIQRGPVDPERIQKLHAEIERLHEAPPTRARARGIAAWWEAHAGALSRWGVVLPLALVLALAARAWWPNRHDPSSGKLGVAITADRRHDKLSVWIAAPQLQGDHLDEDYDALRAAMDDVLLAIAQAAGLRRRMRILSDADIDKDLMKAGCLDRTKRNQVPECVDTVAVEHLAIRVKVEPTFSSSGQARRLTLQIGDGFGVEGRPHKESPRDANIASLADWGAQQIASFIGIDNRTINTALATIRGQNQRLEETVLGGASASPPPSRPGLPEVRGALDRSPHGWLQWLVASALADQVPSGDDRAVRKLLDQLRSALQSRDVREVEPLFVSMPRAQQESLQRYLAGVGDLRIEFGEPEITFTGDTASATFLRRDQFIDAETHTPVQLAIRLVAVLARTGGGWKIQSLQKPS